MTQPDKIQLIINKSCEYFGIEWKELSIPVKSKLKRYDQERKMICYILYENTSLNYIRIGKLLNYGHHTSVSIHHRNVKEELGDDMYAFDKTKKVYKELMEYIGL